MADPLSVIVVAGAAGGAASKFIERAWDSGEKWLKWYFQDHQEIAIEAANNNALHFLGELAIRINKLEEQIGNSETEQAKIVNALQDPDFSAILKEALVSAARTNNVEKHIVLSRLVAERLRGEPDSLLSLATALSVEAVAKLSPKHLALLGVVTFIYYIRPRPFPPEGFTGDLAEWWMSWITNAMKAYSSLESPTAIDFAHLTAASCLRYEPILSRDLMIAFYPIFSKQRAQLNWPSFKFFSESDAGKHLAKLWNDGVQSLTLTSVGILTGSIVHQEKTGTYTVVDW